MKYSLFATATLMSFFATISAQPRQCGLTERIICNDFKARQGKLCSNVCYNRDDRIENKPCTSETAGYCQEFINNGGYVCSNVYCLIN